MESKFVQSKARPPVVEAPVEVGPSSAPAGLDDTGAADVVGAPAPAIAVERRSRSRADRCPHCHAGVETVWEQQVVCGRCLARHHAGCWPAGEVCRACGETERLVSEPRPAERRRHERLLARLHAGESDLALAELQAEGLTAEEAYRELAQLAFVEVAGRTDDAAPTDGAAPGVEGLRFQALGMIALAASGGELWPTLQAAITLNLLTSVIIAGSALGTPAAGAAFRIGVGNVTWFCVMSQLAVLVNIYHGGISAGATLRTLCGAQALLSLINSWRVGRSGSPSADRESS